MGFKDNLAKEVAALNTPKPADKSGSKNLPPLFTPEELARNYAIALSITPELLVEVFAFLDGAFQITRDDLASLSLPTPANYPTWLYSRKTGKRAWFLLKIKGVPHELYLGTRIWDSKLSRLFHFETPTMLYCAGINDLELLKDHGVQLNGPFDPWGNTIIVSELSTLTRLTQIPPIFGDPVTVN